MSAIDTSAVARFSIFSRLASYVAELDAAFARYKVFSRTLNELNSLSDRELNDIGLGRGDLKDIARKTAFGA